MSDTPLPPIPRTPLIAFPGRLLVHLVFWSWNAVFLAVAALGIAPLYGVALLAEAFGDLAVWSLVGAVLLVIVVPLSSTTLGAAMLRRDPARLFRLFYAVEAPLFVLALGRLFLVRDLTPGAAYVLAASCAGVSAYLYRLLRGAEEERPLRVVLALAGDTVGLWAALYAAALLAFFALPAAGMLAEGFFRFEWLSGLFRMLWESPAVALFLLLGSVLFFFSATLFALLPPVLFVLYVQRFATGARWASARLGLLRAGIAVAAASAALVGGFLVAVRQPQQAALAALAEPPADDAARRARLAIAEPLRDGLTNAYLAPFRYLGSTAGAEAVRDVWQHALHVDRRTADDAQAAFDVVARPFLFEGDEREPARRRAAELYAGFFDRSIQRGEKQSVLAAISATYSREEREAGLLTEGGRKVHVAVQEARIVEAHGDWAEIELHEAYENQTGEQQEVFYFFSLPETAAVTGLWLGDADDRAAASSFQVSPRGAAQRVYRGEVARRRDPALLEQVGPRQYRLRAFPIPARELPRGGTRAIPERAAMGRPMHLWMRYRVLADGASFPLPRLAEERNAFRDRATRRTFGGKESAQDPGVWLPPSLPAGGPVAPREHRARVGERAVVVATPETAPTALPSGRRLAVVLDRSYSMGPQAERAVAAMDFIRARIEPSNDVDLYLTSASSRGEPPRRLDDPRALDARGVVYYGGQDPAELLEQFEALRGDTRYDGVVVLTDAGGFDLSGPRRKPLGAGAPVWMVHLGGVLAPGYDDSALEAIQKHGGGATTSVVEAFTRLAAASADPSDLGWADGYRFRLDEGGSDGPADGFGAIAARRFIPRAARAAGPEGLDAVHRVAREHGVVTAYSSMIVLVDDAQRQALRDAEARADRFERDAENGEARLRAPSSPLGGDLTGTPEPEEWILLGLSAAALLWMARRRAPRLASA